MNNYLLLTWEINPNGSEGKAGLCSFPSKREMDDYIRQFIVHKPFRFTCLKGEIIDFGGGDNNN